MAAHVGLAAQPGGALVQPASAACTPSSAAAPFAPAATSSAAAPLVTSPPLGLAAFDPAAWSVPFTPAGSGAVPQLPPLAGVAAGPTLTGGGEVMSGPPVLPPGWQSGVDPSTGVTYYCQP